MGRFSRGQPHEQEDLVCPVTEAEIKLALFHIGDDKALGPDGYTWAFFMKIWETVGSNVYSAVNEFFTSGQILKNLNHTYISLIPKKTHNPTISYYHPIACTNVFYKMITKILANMMNCFLGKLVNPCQTAFVKGQNITDNFLLAQELIRNYMNGRSSLLVDVC